MKYLVTLVAGEGTEEVEAAAWDTLDNWIDFTDEDANIVFSIRADLVKSIRLIEEESSESRRV